MRFTSKLAVAAAFTLGAAAGGYGIANAASTPTPGPADRPAQGTAASRSALATVVQPNPMAVFVPLKNCRAVATATAGGKIPSGATRDFQITGTTGFTAQGGPASGCGVPSYATAVSARLTAAYADANGVFITYPTGTPVAQGTLFYGKGVNQATAGTFQLGTGGKITIKNNNGPAHLAFDVNGYFTPQIQAHIELDGTLTSGTRLVTASSRLGTGVFVASIARDVSACAAHADPDGSGGYISSAVPSGSTVTIYTYNLAGTPTNIRFTLSVTC